MTEEFLAGLTSITRTLDVLEVLVLINDSLKVLSPGWAVVLLEGSVSPQARSQRTSDSGPGAVHSALSLTCSGVFVTVPEFNKVAERRVLGRKESGNKIC